MKLNKEVPVWGVVTAAFAGVLFLSFNQNARDCFEQYVIWSEEVKEFNGLEGNYAQCLSSIIIDYYSD